MITLEFLQNSGQKSFIVVKSYFHGAIYSVCLYLHHLKDCKTKDNAIVQSRIGSRIRCEKPRSTS